ncbi:MAG: hypothetical protein RR056_01280 [Acetivibrio sp.]
MEKVINLLNDIEEKATSIVDHTSVEKKVLYQQLAKDIQKLDDHISKETQTKLDVIRQKMNGEMEEAKIDLHSSFEKNMKHLESDYSKNHDIYTETIFQHIINE